MEIEKNIIMRTEKLAKFYGRNKQEARKMLEKGATKEDVQKKTGTTVALWDINLEIKEGETFVIIGLSGSGKSTLVRCFNRLNKPTYGDVYYRDSALKKLSKEELQQFRRNRIAMVFQSFGLMSHRDVLGNVEYGMEIKGLSKEARKQKAIEMLNMVGLNNTEHSSLASLSGGMKQRVGLARALANDPEILLMDEPFSALDPLVKQEMQFELLQIQQKLKKTIIFITHDINEAFKIGDRVAIMRDGRLIQVDTPENMITNPADDYVRSFIEGADKAQVFSVKNVVLTPSTLIRENAGPNRALSMMRANNVSSAYVVDDDMNFKGVITLDSIMKIRELKSFEDQIITDLPHVQSEESIADILHIAAEARFPIPVVENNKLLGIVSKASVLSLLSSNGDNGNSSDDSHNDNIHNLIDKNSNDNVVSNIKNPTE